MFKTLMEKARALLDPVGAVQERRDVIRLTCRVPVQIQVDGTYHDGMVSNISLQGLRVETARKMKKTDRIAIGQANSKSGSVACQVMWVRPTSKKGSYSNGIKFEDTQENLGRSWLRDCLRQLGFEPGRIRERRNFIRFPAPSQVRAALTNRTGDQLTDGRLLNIGYGGALAAFSVEVPPNTPIRLQLDPTLDSPPLDCCGMVRSSIKDVKRQMHVTGLEFDMQGEPQIKAYIRAIKKKLNKL